MLDTSLAALLVALLAGCGDPTASDTHPTPSDADADADADADTDADTDTPLVAERLCQLDVSCPGAILDDPKAPCSASVTDGDGILQYDGPAGVELRGRSSLYFPKPQYSVELRAYNELPVWPGSNWSYLDGGADPGAGWNLPGYDDSAWQSGPAPMGYGESYLATELLPAGPKSRSLTTWFRKDFDVANLDRVTHANVAIRRNDGAAVYLNGVEIQRDNLAPGALYDSAALSQASATDELTWHEAAVDPALFVAGTNVLAVEVHQWAAESPDLRFDLYLEATGDDAPTDLLGMGKDSDWIFNGQYVDRALFRNRLAYDLFQSLGGPERYATATQFCELTLDGEYAGIYTLGEKIEREDTRVDIGAGDHPGDTFLIKLDDTGGFHANAVGYGTWQLVYPDPLDPVATAAVSARLSEWEAAISGPNPGDPDTGMFASLDLDSAVDFVLVEELMKNHDAYLLSVYLWQDQGGKMHFTPWALDLSLGYPYDDCGATGWAARVWTTEGQPNRIAYIDAMAADPAFHAALVARWTELRAGPFAESALLARIAAYDATLAPALAAEEARWPVDEIAFGFGGVDNWLCPVTDYADEHARVLAFISARLTWMDANIDQF